MGLWFCSQVTSVQIPVQSLSSCVMPTKLLNVSESRLQRILGAAKIGVGTLRKPFTHSLEPYPVTMLSGMLS